MKILGLKKGKLQTKVVQLNGSLSTMWVIFWPAKRSRLVVINQFPRYDLIVFPSILSVIGC